MHEGGGQHFSGLARENKSLLDRMRHIVLQVDSEHARQFDDVCMFHGRGKCIFHPFLGCGCSLQQELEAPPSRVEPVVRFEMLRSSSWEIPKERFGSKDG